MEHRAGPHRVQAAVADGSFDAALATSAAAAAPGAAARGRGATSTLVAEMAATRRACARSRRARGAVPRGRRGRGRRRARRRRGHVRHPRGEPVPRGRGRRQALRARRRARAPRTRGAHARSERWCACDSRALCGAHFAEAVCCAPTGACCDARVPARARAGLFLGAGAVPRDGPVLPRRAQAVARRRRRAPRVAPPGACGYRCRPRVVRARRGPRPRGPPRGRPRGRGRGRRRGRRSPPAGRRAHRCPARNCPPLPRALSPVLTASEADARTTSARRLLLRCRTGRGSTAPGGAL